MIVEGQPSSGINPLYETYTLIPFFQVPVARNIRKIEKTKKNRPGGPQKYNSTNFEKIIMIRFGALMGPTPLGGPGGRERPPVTIDIQM